MATSKKEPMNSSRDRATRMSPNLRPSSSESSGYGVRRARSVPSSPDRKFGSSSSSMAAPGSTGVNRPSLSSAGRSRTISGSGSSIHGSKAQPFHGSVSKPMLARAKSDKGSTTTQRPPALAVPPSNSFKDMARTVSKASPSTLLRSKLSPRPCADNCKVSGSPKPITQGVASPVAARGGRAQPISTARSPGAVAKRFEAGNGAAVSSKAKGASQKVMGASTSRKEKEEDLLVQLKETGSVSTPSIEEHLHEQLPDPVDLRSTDVAVPDHAEASANQPEQQVKNDEAKGHFSEEKEDAAGNELRSVVQDANGGIKTVQESGLVENKAGNASGTVDKNDTVPLLDRTEVAQAWRKDDPKGNDVIEEAKSKLLEERKSRVKALVGAFETVMSFKE